jgi:hypothetical protein
MNQDHLCSCRNCRFRSPLHRCSNDRSPLTTFLLIRYGKVGYTHKYPSMVWTHPFTCCESSNFNSVFNSYILPSSLSKPRQLAFRQLYPLSNWYSTVVLKTCNGVMFFVVVVPSKVCRFKFSLSWLCDDHIAADTFVMKGSRQHAMTAPSPRCRRTTDFKDWRYINCFPRAGWRFADGDGYRSEEPINLSKYPILAFSQRSGFLCEIGTPLFFEFFEYLVIL